MLVKILSSFSIGFLGGVLLHSIVSSEHPSLVLAVVAFGISFLCLFFLHSRKVFILAICFFIGCGFGVLRYASSLDAHSSSVLDVFVQEETFILVHGTIVSDPIDKVSFKEFVLDVDYLIVANQTLPVRTRILVKTEIHFDYAYGQSVVVRGKVQKPQAFETDTHRIFNYRAYLAKDGIYYTMSYTETNILDQGKRGIVGSLYELKHRLLYSIYQHIPQPESGLLAGILFGQESALGSEYEEKFRTVGLTHIVVLSGYNVSIVILLFMRLFAFVPRLPRAGLAVLSIASFALLVGAGPTVIRASLMAVFIVLAELLHRRYHIERALIIAGFLMVLWNPKVLYFDISFQLSFLATYGLIVISPWLENKLSFLPKTLLIRESAVATLAAQIMVLPLLLYSIGEFSVISPVVNVLVLFAVPWAMGFGFLSALAGIALTSLIAPFALVSTWLLSYQLRIVDMFSSWSFASLSFPPFHWILMVIMYAFIFFWVRKISRM